MKYSIALSSLLIVLPVVFSSASLAESAEQQALVAKYIEESFQHGDNQHRERLVQDETQIACTLHRNKVPPEVAQEITKREREALKYPENGQKMGDWKEGEKHFKSGFAWRVGRIEPSRPDATRGGNCYACHAADPKEVAAGNLGTSLTGYGKVRGNSEAIIGYTYEKIYNPQAFMPCSNMPRLGHNGVLTPEQIADIVAYLIDPESPVNQ